MISEIRPNFFFIERGWLNANHFVFNGKQKILIDTGYGSDFEETRRWIEAAGVDLKSVDLIISTHSHCDHIGGNNRIREISGCRISIHPLDKQSIDRRDDWATWYRFYDQEAEFFPVDDVLEEGGMVSLGDLELQILHTPGHARGGISLYCSRERFLISSDALWDGDLGVLNTIVEGKGRLSRRWSRWKKSAPWTFEPFTPAMGESFPIPKPQFEGARKSWSYS